MVIARRGIGLTEVHWKAVFGAIDECCENPNVPQDIHEEATAFLAQFKPAVIDNPSYRDVVLTHPDMNVTKGMRSVGIHWPEADKLS